MTLHVASFVPNSFSPLSVEDVEKLRVRERNVAQMHLSVMDKKRAEIDLTIKDVFITTINRIDYCGVDNKVYDDVKDLFFKLIIDPNHTVVETDYMHALEDSNVVYVKYRLPENRLRIAPGVSVPFLYFFSSPDHCMNGSLSLNRLARTLNLHTNTLLHQIGLQISRPVHELPDAFEKVLPLAELITVAARLSTKCQVISIQDVLPGVKFRPWDRESLTVSPFVIRDAITLSVPTNNQHPADYEGQSAQKRAVCGAVESKCDAVYIHQDTIWMEQIEHISRLFSVGDQVVLSFCSMKLRKGTRPKALTEQMHEFIKEEIQTSSKYNLQDHSYYAVLYCCCSSEDIDESDLPPGTVVVPYETVRALLYPFGLSHLVLMAGEKTNAKN